MTMPVAPGTRVVELPPPQFPMLMMMFTDKLVPDKSTSPVSQWVVSKEHPIDPTVNILRMFADDEGVEVYSATADGTCIRDFIPVRFIRFTRETMPPDMFAEELEKAEFADDDDPDPDPEPEPEVSIPPNGQASS